MINHSSYYYSQLVPHLILIYITLGLKQMKLVNVYMSKTHVDTFAQVYTFQCLLKIAIRGSLGNRYKESAVARLGSLGNRYKESAVARLPTHSVMSEQEEIAVLYRF